MGRAIISPFLANGSKLLLILTQDGFPHSDRLQHGVSNQKTAAIHRRDNVLRRRRGTRNDVNVDFEPRADHAERIANAVLIVNGKFLGQDVNDLAFRRQRDRARGFDDAPDIVAVDFARPGRYRCNPAAVETLDVRAREPDIDCFHFAAGHGFGFADAFLDRFHSRFNVDDRAFLEPLRFRDTEAKRLQTRLTRDCNERRDFRGTDIKTYNVFFFAPHTICSPVSSRRIFTMT